MPNKPVPGPEPGPLIHFGHGHDGEVLGAGQHEICARQSGQKCATNSHRTNVIMIFTY